jgi:hypothetical protein
MLLTNLENETNYVEDWLLKKTEKVKHDIIKCWNLLKRENEEEIKTDSLANFNHDDSSLLVRQLKATFKFFNSYKLTKNILNLESTMHRVVLTSDSKFVYAAGNGCKVRKREMNVQSNNIFTDKSTAAVTQSTMSSASLSTRASAAGSTTATPTRSSAST